MGRAAIENTAIALVRRYTFHVIAVTATNGQMAMVKFEKAQCCQSIVASVLKTVARVVGNVSNRNSSASVN